jgi:3-hydroxy-3-methylglutaryl CoA synthase/uncharacterized OB-fold protein
MPIEKPVCNFDEDTITMAVAAGMDCIRGEDRNSVDSLFFATSTPPYIEKQNAAMVAAAIDLRREITTNDITNSLRAGTLALKSALDAVGAGSARQVLVAAADARTAEPGSEIDQAIGDGAGALLIGSSNVIASVIATHTVSEETQDYWRAEGDNYVRSWEDRFVFDTGYMNIMPEAVAGLLKKQNMTIKQINKAVFYGPNPRRHQEMVRKLGLAPEQVQDPLFGKMNNTGAAYPIMLLIAALETAKPGEKILLASYGDGADACLLEVTDAVKQVKPKYGIKVSLETKRIARRRGPRGAEMKATEGAPPSVSARWRQRDAIDRLHGAKCLNCGLVQYPQQRVCSRCHTKDRWETVRLSDKKGKIFTFSLDYLVPGVDRPLAICIVDFDGGGRALLTGTDRDVEPAPGDIHCDAPVEMSFRKLRSSGGVHNYYWKCVPQRYPF